MDKNEFVINCSNLRLQIPLKQELILLHDFYNDSPEPDAPRKKFNDLSKDEQNLALKNFNSDSHRAVFDESVLIGFFGFYPDDDSNINIFSVIDPNFRGKGYFIPMLTIAIAYVKFNFKDYKYLRALTRKNNKAALKGLLKSGFHYKGQLTEEVQPDVCYEEYIYEITS